jgi:hypothetical protein
MSGVIGVFIRVLQQFLSPGALVAALTIGVLAVIANVLLLARQGKRLPSAWSKRMTILQDQFRLDSLSYGFYKEKWDACCNLTSKGSCQTRYETTVNAIAHEIPEIEYFGENLLAPPGVKFPMDITAKASVHASPITQIRIERVTQSSKRLSTLKFEPPIPKEGSITYPYATQAPRGSFAMTFEELEKRHLEHEFYPGYEFYARRVTYPTKHFYFKMIFPKGFEPIETGYDVWFGLAKVQHENECDRIASNGYWLDGYDESGRRYIQLKVDYPILGLRYVLKWVPPHSK